MNCFSASIALISLGALCLTTLPLEAQNADPPSFETLAKTYQYDSKKPLDAKEEAQKDSAWHLTFAGTDGKPVPGVFMRPKASGKYPVVLLLHGLTSNKETMAASFGTELVKRGFAVLALDAPFHGERKPKNDDAATAQREFQTRFVTTFQVGIKDWRRGLDYLATRPDVDTKRIGLIGYSMGSMMGSILAATDSRVKASAFCVGGDPILGMAANLPPAAKSAVYPIAPSLFVGHIAPRPTLFINGKQDNVVNEAAAKRFYDAAQKPKEIIWADAGHILPPKDAGKAVDWIEKTLTKKNSE
jgi:uncharacterized protein